MDGTSVPGAAANPTLQSEQHRKRPIRLRNGCDRAPDRHTFGAAGGEFKAFGVQTFPSQGSPFVPSGALRSGKEHRF